MADMVTPWQVLKNIALDFIGKFETLEPDFSAICERLCCPNITLPRLNQSPHKHYSEWYTPETKHLVTERFAQDLKLFAYQFEQV